MNQPEPLWKCTVCGRTGTVGRCCGEETRTMVTEDASSQAKTTAALHKSHGPETLLPQLKWNLWWRGPIHGAICWYLRQCSGAFHYKPYGPDGRYVVLMTDKQYHIKRAARPWIPVAERMPDTGRRVFVFCENGWRIIARWYPAGTFDASNWDDPPDQWWDESGNMCRCPDDGWWESAHHSDNAYMVHNVTHWMPLPEKPEVGK